MRPDTMMIDEVKYVQEDAINKPAEKVDGMEYCIVRTYSAGVFAGYVEKREGKEVVLRNSRGIWYWAGACGLSQLATDGTNKPDSCKFTVVVDRRTVMEAIEIIPCTEKAKESIAGVAVWKK